MLEDYCNSLTDEAQLKIALRLCRLALPVWNYFFDKNPHMLTELNALIEPGNMVKGGVKKIDKDFVGIALSKIEKSYQEAKLISKDPVSVIKKDPDLFLFLATSLQPLTNPEWDNTLPYTVRLVFTSTWNILTWLLYRKVTTDNETHIYVAINQAADALMSENILDTDEIESILNEYKNETRMKGKSHASYETVNSENDANGNQEAIMEQVYKKIISGEGPVSDPPTRVQKIEVLRQMRKEDKTFWDQWEEYYHGTSKTYSYNKEMGCFWRSEADVIVGSFFDEYPMSEGEMLDFLSGISVHDLREEGFDI